MRCKLMVVRNYFFQKRHAKSAHSEPSEMSYVCDICLRSFAVSAKLKRHVREVHLKEKSFSCSVCQRSFVRKYDSQVHEKSCSAKFKSLAELANIDKGPTLLPN